MNMRSRGCCLALAILMITGCGGGGGLPEGETGTVTGRVTYKGEPVPEGCTVLFMGSEDGLLATGATNASGDYVLSMREGLDIVAGTYRVSVMPPDPAATMSQEEAMEKHMAGQLPDPAKVKEVPERYRSPESSALVCSVKPGSNTFDIKMDD